MGHVTISLEDKDERKLRAIAKEKYSNKKGAMAKVISESLCLLEKESIRQRAMERQLRWMRKGFNLGGLAVKRREDFYDRKF
ncbi:MAG: hypothetical protein PHD95_00490 [Candidatus ainarchaeum sp.]|nr:hypothetical protein [Candidatus ainarchaeum sp.]